MASALDNDARAHAKWRGPSDSMFDLSRTKNVIHIVLDGFQSDVFDDILREDRERLDKSFSGAVFFADHAGAFPTTIASIPAMLTGDTSYRNEQPLQSYFRDRFEHGSLFKSLRAAGYRVDNITTWQFEQFFGDPRLLDSAPVHGLSRVHSVCRLGACRSVVVPACASRPARGNLQRSEVASPASIRTTRHEHSPVSLGKRRRRSRRIRTAVDPGGGRPAVQVHARRHSPPAGRAQRKL